MAVGTRSIALVVCCAALAAAPLVSALAETTPQPISAGVVARPIHADPAPLSAYATDTSRGGLAYPTPGMYATDNAGNFFRIDLATAAPSIVSSAFACSALAAAATELEYNNDTHQGIVQDSDGNFSFNTLDFATGFPSSPTTPDGAALQGMEWIYGILLATAIIEPNTPSYLVLLDPVSGGLSPVGPTGVNNISGLAWHEPSHTLYGVTAGGAPSILLTIDINTGAATPVADTGVVLGSLEFGPDGRLYGGGGQANANELYDIDRSTGAATLIGNTGLGAMAITGLALVEDRRDFYAVNNLATTFGYAADTLIRFQFDDPANLTVIGELFDTGGAPLTIAGLDFNQDGSVLYASDGFGPNQGAIYTVNPATAQATLLGTLAAGNGIDDLAWNPYLDDLYGIDADSNTLWANLDDPANALNLGPFSVSGLLNVGLAFDWRGNLYVHDIVSDIIYTAPRDALTTLTPLHNLPFDSGFSEGLFVDWSRDSQGYFGALNNSTFLSEDYLFGTLVTGGGFGPLVGTFPFDAGLGFPLVEVGDLTRRPAPPCGIVNASFETGDFTGWTTRDLDDPLRALIVDPSSGIDTFGWGWGSMATNGLYTAFHGFDGDGAASGHPIKIAQDVWITDHTRLSFDWRAAWDTTFGGTLKRTFDIVVRSAASGLELKRVNVLTAPIGTTVPDTGPQNASIGLGAFQGQAVNVCFEWTIPEDFTGPAQFQLDNVCLAPPCAGDIDGSGVTDIFDFALFARAFMTFAGQPGYNPAADLNHDGAVNILDFGIFGPDFMCPYF